MLIICASSAASIEKSLEMKKIGLFGSPSQKLGNLIAEIYKQLQLLLITKQKSLHFAFMWIFFSSLIRKLTD